MARGKAGRRPGIEWGPEDPEPTADNPVARVQFLATHVAAASASGCWITTANLAIELVELTVALRDSALGLREALARVKREG